MNLQQLISQPDLDEVEFRNIMLKYYPNENPEVFLDIMRNLFNEEVVDNPDCQIKLGRYVESYDDEEEDYEFVDVGLDVLSEKKHYSLSFIPWKEILGYAVDNAMETFVNTHDMTREEVIAHILVEITFYGYTAQAIDDASDSLSKRMEDLKDPVKREQATVTLDELIDILENKEEKDEDE